MHKGEQSFSLVCTSRKATSLLHNKIYFMHTYASYDALYNINLLRVTLALVSQNPREWIFLVSISLLVVMFSSHTSWVLTLK